MAITLDDYLQGREKLPAYKQEYGPYIMNNAMMLLEKVNELLNIYGEIPMVTSGWRPRAYNAQIGGSPTSKHITGDAIDLGDYDGELKKWLVANVEELVKLNLYMESPDSTPSWVHLQNVAPRSKSRIFVP